jgi:hypothetical protein
MNGGATDLERAHARIAELERKIAGTPEGRTARPWAAILRWCALALAILLIAAAFAAAIARPGSEIIVRAAPPPPPMPIPSGELELFSPRSLWDTSGPSLVDVERKGTAHDLLALAWRAGHVDRPMYVVALQRGTYAVLWRSEGIPAGREDRTVSLAATANKIAISDAHGDVHVLDVHTGRELRVIRDAASDRLATLASDPDAVFTIDSGSPARRGSHRIDLETGKLSGSQFPARRFFDDCELDRSRACRRETLPAAKAKLRKIVAGNAAEYAEDLVDDGDGDRITFLDTAPRPQLVDFQLFAWGPDEGALKWKAPAVPAAHQALQGAGSGSHQWLALANHRLVAVYLVGSDGHRVSAHDTTTGKLAYDVALPGLPYGIEVERLTLDGDTGFIMTTGALFVLDAATGEITTTLRRF